MIYSEVYKSRIGDLLIKSEKTAIIEISFLSTPLLQDYNTKSNHILKFTINQLDEFFNKKRKNFTFPIKFLKATDFQLKVWKELRNIKYGSVATYGEIAKRIGNPKAYRAVGNACNKNPLLLVVPCHRIIASNNKIGGFAGGEEIKKYLLNLEKS